MKRHWVAPPERVEPLSALKDTRLRLTLWLSFLSSLGCLLVWWNDERHGMNSPWASVAVPSVAAILALGGLIVWRWPRMHNVVAGLCTISVSVYFIGSLVGTTREGGPSSLYEVASNAQFMPLLYLAAFVTMARGAARLSWFTYGVTVLAYGGLYGLKGPPAGDTIGHFWLMLLVTHPIFILSLSYVSVLHSRLSKAEIEVHAGRERFLAMLSHEIRTPLQGMLGSIDLLDIKVQGAAERRAIDRLRQISAQLTAHLKDLTEYTRMDNPAWRLQPEWVDLIDLVEDICDEHLHRIRAKGLHLLVDAEDDPRIREVETDPSRIRQVLDNLLTNALKYTTTGGITVRLKVLEAGDANGPQGLQAPQPTLPCIQMEVVDTGVGIADEAMARVFEPYVRLEDRKLPRTEGTGLGLAVVRRLVDRLGGSMAVESAPDQGTRFLIWLPMQPLARQ